MKDKELELMDEINDCLDKALKLMRELIGVLHSEEDENTGAAKEFFKRFDETMGFTKK